MLNQDIGGIGLNNVLVNFLIVNRISEEKFIGILKHEISHSLFIPENLNAKFDDIDFMFYYYLISEGLSMSIFYFTYDFPAISINEILHELRKFNSLTREDKKNFMQYLENNYGIHRFSYFIVQNLLKIKTRSEIFSMNEKPFQIFKELEVIS